MSYLASDLPDFNSARTGVDASQLTPPFEFDGVMMRVFPLRASLAQVQSFVDAYINVAPPELCHFRTYLPYVYLMIINYGKMSVNAANLGWISQNEIVFSVPLLWYKKVGGKLVFQDFATISPFIYVDNDLSMTTGREVYGWPKNRINSDMFATAWMTSPEASPVLARFSTMVFPELYAGMRQTPRTLLEVEYTIGSSFTRVPFDPRAAWLPWVTLPKAIAGSVEMTRDYADILRGLGLIREQPGAGLDAYSSMLSQISRSFNLYSPKIIANSINFKQFRDAEHPSSAAYQAITSSPMQLRGFQSGGLLGDRHIFQGDPSGGFSIVVHRYGVAPIVDSLGLEVAAERTQGSVTVHTLRPMFPMWVNVDMSYGVGNVLAWRSKDSEWRDRDGTPIEGRGDAAAVVSYNTARGAAEAEIAGPFAFPNTTLRVLPLLADEGKLAVFLRDYLGVLLASEGVEILPWGRYVYLVAGSYEEMSSETNDIGWWAERDVVFYVPARVIRGGELWKIVLVPAYGYANSATAALTGAEVSGLPMVKSELDSPSNPWMADAGPSAATKRALLSASTMVLPVIELGQKAVDRVVVEVLEGEPIPEEDERRWRSVSQGWAHALKADLAEQREKTQAAPAVFDKARAFALQILCQQRSIHLWTLKQFRDSEHPTKACYQAIVQIDREITEISQIEEIETSLYVGIHRYPTQPIVETLGLVTVAEQISQGGVHMHLLSPVRPFWMKVSLKEHLGKNVFARAGTDVWSGPGSAEIEEEASASPSPKAVGPWVVRAVQLEGEPRRLGALVHDLIHDRSRQIDPPPLSDLDLAKVVETFGPQAVLESILSEEWERWGECRWSSARVRIERAGLGARKHRSGADAAFAEFDALWGVMLKAMTPASVDRTAFAEAAEPLLCALLQSRLLEFFATQRVLKAGGDWGDGPRRTRELVEAYKDCVSKLGRAAQGALGSTAKLEEDLAEIVEQPQRDACHAIIRRHATIARVTHHDLVMILAKAHQKPHHAIRRGVIGNAGERDRVFPLEHSWNEDWYVGLPRA